MSMPNIHRIYLTKVHLNVECDTFYPEFDEDDFTIVRLVIHIPFNLQFHDYYLIMFIKP
jgi:hypothetical protein